MKKLALVVLVCAFGAFAEPREFDSRAPVSLQGSGALHRVPLPFEAYRDARPDLADVRVLDARGKPVPFAWAGEPPAPEPQPEPIALPIFPVAGLAKTPALPAEVTVRAADGTLVEVRPSKGEARAAPPSAFLLDASQLKRRIAALVLDWDAAPGTQIVTVRVESSDDLRGWRSMGGGPLVKLEANGQRLEQLRVPLSPREAKYLRVTWEGASGFALTTARAEPQVTQPAPKRERRVVEAAKGGKAGELFFDLGARLPVEALRVVTAEPNTVVVATFHVRDKADGEWRVVAGGAFHRLRHEGGEIEPAPITVGRIAARYWMARLAPGSAPGAAPALEVQWRPAEVVFVAGGEAPYALAFGDPRAKPSALQLASLIPSYERHAEWALPQARVESVRTEPPPSFTQRWLRTLDTRKAFLWALLIGGVGLLGLFAWRLSRQASPARREPDPSPSGSPAQPAATPRGSTPTDGGAP